jgi:hypothetical protein
VAGNGLLSGTPATSDVGTENFIVLAVNSGDLSGVGLLSITVYSPTNWIIFPVTLHIVAEGANMRLGWSGGASPYQVQVSTNPAAGWQNLGDPTSATNLIIAPATPASFFRILKP